MNRNRFRRKSSWHKWDAVLAFAWSGWRNLRKIYVDSRCNRYVELHRHSPIRLRGLVRNQTQTYLSLDFKLSPCLEYSMSSFGWFPGVWFIIADVSEHSICSIFLGRRRRGITQKKTYYLSLHMGQSWSFLIEKGDSDRWLIKVTQKGDSERWLRKVTQKGDSERPRLRFVFARIQFWPRYWIPRYFCCFSSIVTHMSA
jgi:hypothetical protein